VSEERGTEDAAAVLRLVDIRDEPLSVDEVLAAVDDPGAGGTCVFVGTVRDVDHERAVKALAYSAHPSAVHRLREVMADVAARHPVLGLAAVHRVGDLAVGDLAVVAAASSAHRAEAFEACRDLIDTLKATVPIWKRETWAEGEDWSACDHPVVDVGHL
jgi:molybdopterin synthase catalytic subunit